MGELATVGFTPGNSYLHRLDPRTKQILLMVLGMTSLWANVLFLAITSVVVISMFHSTNLRLYRLIRETRYFLFFLLFLFIIKAVHLNQQLIPEITWSQAVIALIFCWRLLLIVIMGMLLISTTRTAEIRATLIWALKPIPFVNGETTATMVGLIVRFLPLILFEAGEIGDAMRARGVERRQNYLIRMIRFTTTLFRRAFLRADELVDTMQARCYSEHRTLPEISFALNDLIAAAAGILMLLTALIP
ncbi:energy-coupling factor transporter transmembrane component T family protein [Desulfopila inferna]|uniref:energy-coupling factor transporter transmembrane component T family protein n=1 Tax=Desulfopila inferna TaxID=468528 RepID=UPI00196457EE|nr:energy-coupling factor transporter transmembrane component T [Desulfopila inferna]MBM9606238.1 energy-coupling factor transporter transmembrane protein EcfT [Desulfopila inferna]